jgi:site-specific DNA-methyltransferase (adenine-specific)
MITKKQKLVLDYITSYCKKRGYSPALDEIRKHFKLASVSTAHFYIKRLEELGLLEKQYNKPRSIDIYENDKMINIPLLGLISAGQPIATVQNKETIAVPQNKLPHSGEFYALRVLGNSMIDENINNGDIVLVKQQSVAENGQKVVALIDNHEATLKKFYKERGHIRLQPANKTIEPIIIKRDKELTIQGIVIDVIKNEEKLQATELLPQKEIKKFSALPLNEIICGDAVEIMKAMPPNSVDLVVTSPPYDELRNYNGYTFNFEGMARGLLRVIKKGGVLVWVVGDKINKGNKSLTSFRQNCYEFMFVFSKGSPSKFYPLKTKTARQGQEMLPFNKKADGINKKTLGKLKPEKTLTNIWEYAVGLHGSTSDKIAFQHTAIFPEKLAEDHILSWTKEVDVVFDPMCGSGTTCKMAATNKRHYIGCDISKEYVDLTKKRLKYANLQ